MTRDSQPADQVSADHVIVLPGGAYSRHSDNEGQPIADWLTSLGLSSSVFRYPIETRHPGVLDAVRGEIRRHRDAGVKRIALIGSSAGGHAAAHAALAPDAAPNERVDLVMLCYPVVSMMLPTHEQSRHNLIGPEATKHERAATSAEMLVTPDAPPFFIWHTTEDVAVPPEHAYLLASALATAGVRHELHVFARGAHGLNLARGSDVDTAAHWTTLCAAWLREEGWVA